jgi:hypothetical protein
VSEAYKARTSRSPPTMVAGNSPVGSSYWTAPWRSSALWAWWSPSPFKLDARSTLRFGLTGLLFLTAAFVAYGRWFLVP